MILKYLNIYSACVILLIFCLSLLVFVGEEGGQGEAEKDEEEGGGGDGGSSC